MTRRELREHCFKMLFCTEFYPEEEKGEQIRQYFDAPDEVDSEDVLHHVEIGEEDRTALEKRVEEISAKIPELDDEINAVAQGWKTRRMGRVELTILRLALFEMRFDDRVPDKVAINEAVELAKKFGGNEAPAFVNGILAKLVKKEEETV